MARASSASAELSSDACRGECAIERVQIRFCSLRPASGLAREPCARSTRALFASEAVVYVALDRPAHKSHRRDGLEARQLAVAATSLPTGIRDVALGTLERDCCCRADRRRVQRRLGRGRAPTRLVPRHGGERPAQPNA